jgi:hypothetical protein
MRMFDHAEKSRDDALLAHIEEELRRTIRSADDDLQSVTAQLIRRAIDEVIDAPRTGRLTLDECEKTEKTYLGTKIEILFRQSIGQPKGQALDLSIAGIDVDIKHSIARSWMIPGEALGKVCLLINENERTARFNMGLIVCRAGNLTAGGNRDKKLQVSAVGMANVRWLVADQPYPRNIWQEFDQALLQRIIAHRGGAARLAELFRNMLFRPIPRSAIPAVAPQLDPLKRVRANGGARDILKPEGIAVLWGSYDRHLIARLNLPPIFGDEFLSVRPRSDEELQLLRQAGHL